MKSLEEVQARIGVILREMQKLSTKHQAGLTGAADLGDLIRLSVELETLRWVAR